MTRDPHKIQPCCSESSSRRLWNSANSSAVFDGQSCRTQFATADNSGSRAVHFDILSALIGVSFTTDSDNTTSAGTGTSFTGVGTCSLLII